MMWCVVESCVVLWCDVECWWCGVLSLVVLLFAVVSLALLLLVGWASVFCNMCISSVERRGQGETCVSFVHMLTELRDAFNFWPLRLRRCLDHKR